MIAAIKNFIVTSLTASSDVLQSRGYNYTAGYLLSRKGSHEAITEIENQISVIDKNAFDVGMICALADFQELTK